MVINILEEQTGGNGYLCLHFCARFEVHTLVSMKTRDFLGCDAVLFRTRLPDVLKDHSACISSQTTQPATQHHMPEDLKLQFLFFSLT